MTCVFFLFSYCPVTATDDKDFIFIVRAFDLFVVKKKFKI